MRRDSDEDGSQFSEGVWFVNLAPISDPELVISAIAVGLAMTIFESSLSSKYFGQQLELPILQELGRVLMVVLSVSLAPRRGRRTAWAAMPATV